MNYLLYFYDSAMSFPYTADILLYGGIIILLLVYRFSRRERWRAILGESLEYHRFHLSQRNSDKNTSEKAREMYQALLWAVNKQLKDDLARSGGKGGPVLWRSFLGDKTCLNTCGTVFYESAKNYRFVDETLIKLNDTLISTFYRILMLESILSPLALVYMDVMLLWSIIRKPAAGTGRLYREMLSGVKKDSTKK